MGQRLTNPFQAKWLPKLLGFNYDISNKSGTENVVADALSRVSSGVELNALILTSITTDLLQQVKDNVMEVIQAQPIQTERNVLLERNAEDGETVLVSEPGYLKMSGNEDHHRQGRRFAAGGNGHDGRDPRDLCFLFIRLAGEQHRRSLLGWPRTIAARVTPSVVEAVDRTMQEREESLHIVKFHLERAQDRMISQANKHRSDIGFEIVAYVLVKWPNHTDENATWENYADLIQRCMVDAIGDGSSFVVGKKMKYKSRKS
nr:reverse transcriptase [Tanacetum cinerariifolium]